MSPYNRVIGDTLKARDDARRAPEVAIAENRSIVSAISGKPNCSHVAQLISRRR